MCVFQDLQLKVMFHIHLYIDIALQYLNSSSSSEDLESRWKKLLLFWVTNIDTRYTFLSNHTIHKSICGLSFRPPDPLFIDFTKIYQLKGLESKNKAKRIFVNVVIWQKSMYICMARPSRSSLLLKVYKEMISCSQKRCLSDLGLTIPLFLLKIEH